MTGPGRKVWEVTVFAPCTRILLVRCSRCSD